MVQNVDKTLRESHIYDIYGGMMPGYPHFMTFTGRKGHIYDIYGGQERGFRHVW